MKVRTRLLAAFAVILIFIWVIIGAAVNRVRIQNAEIGHVQRDVMPALATANHVEVTVNEALLAVTTAYSAATPDNLDRARAALNALSAFEGAGDTGDLARIDPDGSLAAQTAAIRQGLASLLADAAAGPAGPIDAAPAYEKATADFAVFQQAMSSKENDYLAALQTAGSSIISHFFVSQTMLFSTTGALTLVALGAAIYTSRSIVRPLTALREGTEKIAAGDLNYRVGTQARDEIGELSRSFDRLTRNLVASTASVENLYREITTRQQAEAALRESEEKLRTLLELGTDGYLTVDLKGTVTSCNEAFTAMIGTTVDAALGQNMAALPAVGAPQLKRLFKAAVAGKPTKPVELSWEHPDGRTMTAEFRTGPFHAGDAVAGVELTVTDLTARKKAERELKESEERLQAYFDNAPDGIVLNRPDGTILYANGKAEQITGYAREELVGRNFFQVDLFPEPWRPRAIAGMERIKTGKPSGPEDFQIRRKNGSLLWVSVHAAPVKHQGQTVTLALMRDISERIHEEQIVRQERERARHYLDVAGTMLLALDTSGKVTLLNRKGAELLGYTEKAAVGRDWFETFVPAPRRAEIGTLFKRLLQGEEHLGRFTVHPVVTASGEERQISWYNTVIRDEHGRVTGTLSSGEDVTERLRTEKALRISDAALKSMHDAIIVMDNDFNVIEWNSVCEEMFGVPREDIIGKFIGTAITMVEDHPGQNRERIQQLQERGFNREEQVYRTPRGDIWVDVHIQAIEAEGKRTGWVTLVMDITERNQAAEKLRRLDEMKLEFLSNVSHELRTPLQSISGFTKLLIAGEVPDQERQREFLGIIDSETLRLQHLINGLLDMSRLETGKFRINRRTVAVDSIIRDSVAVLRSLSSNKEFSVEIELPAALPPVEADPDRLHQVLLNLLGNAIKFSPPGSSVTVRAARRDGDLLVQVLDRGRGIAAEDKEHLFERFYRGAGEKVEGGSGLGLYISRQIIEAHGGHIRAENRPEGGSIFSFTLPLTVTGGTAT